MTRHLLHVHKDAATPARATTGAITVGAQLDARAGVNCHGAALAIRLGCSPEQAEQLRESWLPQGPQALRDQTLLVFSRALELDLEELHRLLDLPQAPPAAAPAADDSPYPPHSLQEELAKARPAPTILWRKRRAVVPPGAERKPGAA